MRKPVAVAVAFGEHANPTSMRKPLLERTPLPAIIAEVRDYVRVTPGKTFVGLIVAPILLTLVLRLGTPPIGRVVLLKLTPAKLDSLYHWYYVFITQFILLYVIPVVCIKVGFKEKLSDYGHQIVQVFRLWPLLILFLLVMLPLTYASSIQPAFRTFYPLYEGASRGWDRFLLFEAGILLVFFSQEFFFRGFLIEILKPGFGKSAILIASAIYGVTHYTKPLPEQLGAFFVGLLLGYIGDRYRTFYFGVVVHYLIALSMDAYLVVPKLLGGAG
jgi:uncharacterized protein